MNSEGSRATAGEKLHQRQALALAIGCVNHEVAGLNKAFEGLPFKKAVQEYHSTGEVRQPSQAHHHVVHVALKIVAAQLKY